MNIKFPDSFRGTFHPVVPGASQWLVTKPNGFKISIVGGGMGLYGDGVRTFEMYDFEQDEPQGYMTEEEINDYLSSLNADGSIPGSLNGDMAQLSIDDDSRNPMNDSPDDFI